VLHQHSPDNRFFAVDAQLTVFFLCTLQVFKRRCRLLCRPTCVSLSWQTRRYALMFACGIVVVTVVLACYLTPLLSVVAAPMNQVLAIAVAPPSTPTTTPTPSPSPSFFNAFLSSKRWRPSKVSGRPSNETVLVLAPYKSDFDHLHWLEAQPYPFVLMTKEPNNNDPFNLPRNLGRCADCRCFAHVWVLFAPPCHAHRC
jgi:hypothetical protein